MSQRKSNRAGGPGANHELFVLVLDTLDAFSAEVMKTTIGDTEMGDRKVVYLTSTDDPMAEPSQGRAPGAICAVLSYRLSLFSVACYIEPLPLTAIDMQAAPERSRVVVNERLQQLTETIEAEGHEVRRGRWDVGRFETVTP